MDVPSEVFFIITGLILLMVLIMVEVFFSQGAGSFRILDYILGVFKGG